MNIETKFRQVLQSTRHREEAYTKIAVIGQPGAGKSSLINNLLGQKVAETGPETDVTQKVIKYDFYFMKIYDTPGYGTEKFSYPEWEKICDPGQFDVFVYVFSGKFTAADDALFDELRGIGKPLFLVRSYSDNLIDEAEKIAVIQDMQKRFQNFEKLYFVSCGRIKDGISELRKDVLNPEFRDLWKNRIRYLFTVERDVYLGEAKRKATDCIDSYKKVAGINGLNPIPGLDIGVDLGLYFKMFCDVRSKYGIDNKDFSTYIGVPIAVKLMQLLTKEGIVLLLKNMGTKYVSRTILKYIPVLGQAAAFALSWKLCKAAGDDYSENCFLFAKNVMNNLIEEEVSNLSTGL